MPHAELKYSRTLKLDATAILAEIERVIQSHDAGSGECKGRAYPCDATHHQHVLIQIGLLRKPHRDDAFMQGLLYDIKHAVLSALPDDIYVSIGLEFSGPHYLTGHIRELKDA